MVPVFLPEAFEDAQRFLDVMRIFWPVNRPASPAMIPTILAARGAVQIQQKFQAILAALLQSEVDKTRAFHVGLRGFKRPITHREPDGIQAAIPDPAKVGGGDKSVTVPVKPA